MNLTRWVRLQWDRVSAWAAIAAGALCLIAGGLQIRRTPYPAEQLPYILTGGVAAIFLLGLGAMLWLSADLRDEWRTLDRLEEVTRQALDRFGGQAVPTGAEPSMPEKVRAAQ
ncbi:MAG TPA: hypothetical protein VHL53_07860 [Acidimicrobiia bacterium]|nr:hypothetical protein [Acidimicrobiia bacterium]